MILLTDNCISTAIGQSEYSFLKKVTNRRAAVTSMLSFNKFCVVDRSKNLKINTFLKKKKIETLNKK